MRKKRRFKNTTPLLIAGGIVFVLAAIFGVYKLSDAVLNRVLPSPNAVVSSAVPSSEAVISSQPALTPESETLSSAAVGSAASSAGNADLPVITGIFGSYNTAAQRKLSAMTLKEKVGQVFIFRCPESGAVKTAEEYQPGGYCLMAANFQNKTIAQVQSMLKSYQSASKTHMILCCDEEGGTVVRISKYPALAASAFKSPQQVFKRSGLDGIYNDTVKKAQLLKKLGLNLNLAPVCDVSTNSSDFIYDRSFGKDAAQTAKFVTTSVNAYNSQNLSSTLKHFPGYGNNKDTHTGIAYDKRSYSTFTSSDFLPFTAGINAGAQCILVSHNIVSCMDAKNPASLSPKVHSILREELGFTGVIMTDDLSMDAIPDFTGGKNPSVAAFNAGNDILLSSNTAEDFNALYAAVQNGSVTEQRLNESVLRILAWKYKMGII
ncbi:MAG: beta-hexosaminidase [Caproiciproducens sp.]|nr:beta-hexosaminidase [Caproiciproducens sp.]